MTISRWDQGKKPLKCRRETPAGVCGALQPSASRVCGPPKPANKKNAYAPLRNLRKPMRAHRHTLNRMNPGPDSSLPTRETARRWLFGNRS